MPYRTEINGDVTDFDCDAIVNSLGINGAVYGKICKNVIKKANSPELKARIDNLRNQKVGTIYVTKGFDLPAKNIIHIVTPFKVDEEDIDNENLVNAYRFVIAKAIELKYKSIALPFLGTGANGYTKNDSYQAAMKAIGDILYQEEQENRDIIEMILMVYFPKHRKLHEERDRVNEEFSYLQKEKKIYESIKVFKDEIYIDKSIPDLKKRKNPDDFSMKNIGSIGSKSIDTVSLEDKCLSFPFIDQNRFKDLVEINGPYTFESLNKIPSVNVFKKYERDYEYIDNQYFLIKMAKIEMLHNLMDPKKMFIPTCKYYIPYDFLVDYFKQTKFNQKKLAIGGLDRRVKSDFKNGLKEMTKLDIYKFIKLAELTPVIALEFMQIAGFTFSPYDDLDMFMVDYLLGVYGTLDSIYNFSAKAREVTKDNSLKLYFEKYNETPIKNN